MYIHTFNLTSVFVCGSTQLTTLTVGEASQVDILPTCVNRCSRGERRVSDLWCVHMYIHAFNLTQDITMMYAGCVCVDTAV